MTTAAEENNVFKMLNDSPDLILYMHDSPDNPEKSGELAPLLAIAQSMGGHNRWAVRSLRLMIRHLKRNKQKIGYIARCPAHICLTRIIPLIVRHDRRHKGTRRECWTELAWTTEQLRNKGQSGDNIIITHLRIFQQRCSPAYVCSPAK